MPALNQHTLPNTDALHSSPSSDPRARDQASTFPWEIRRELADHLFIEHYVVCEDAILVGRQPRPSRRAIGEVLSVDYGSYAVPDAEIFYLVAYGNNLAAGGIVADDAVRYHGLRVPTVRDVGISIIQRDGVDFDQYGSWSQG